MINKLYDLLPIKDNHDFNYIVDGILKPFKNDLINTHQELKWHGEDDVLTHTLMVINELIRLNEFEELSKLEKLTIFPTS